MSEDSRREEDLKARARGRLRQRFRDGVARPLGALIWPQINAWYKERSKASTDDAVAGSVGIDVRNLSRKQDFGDIDLGILACLLWQLDKDFCDLPGRTYWPNEYTFCVFGYMSVLARPAASRANGTTNSQVNREYDRTYPHPLLVGYLLHVFARMSQLEFKQALVATEYGKPPYWQTNCQQSQKLLNSAESKLQSLSTLSTSLNFLNKQCDPVHEQVKAGLHSTVFLKAVKSWGSDVHGRHAELAGYTSLIGVDS